MKKEGKEGNPANCSNMNRHKGNRLRDIHETKTNAVCDLFRHISVITNSVCDLFRHMFMWSKKAKLIETESRGFPGGSMVKNPPANAGDTDLTPGLGRSQMPRDNYWACALEPKNCYYWVPCCNSWAHVLKTHAPHQEKPPQWEVHALHPQNSFCLLQLEKAAKKTQHSQK